MEYLTAEDILRVHSVVIDETGGSHGLRDGNALRALEELPRQAAFGADLYPDLFQKAALYVRNIIVSHPFVDGNKRTAVTAAGVFLQLNGWSIIAQQGGIEGFALDVIEKKLSLEEIAEWLRKNAKKLG